MSAKQSIMGLVNHIASSFKRNDTVNSSRSKMTAKPKQVNIVIGNRQSGVTTKLLRFAAKQLANKGVDSVHNSAVHSPICFFTKAKENAEAVRADLESIVSKDVMKHIRIYPDNAPVFIAGAVNDLMDEGLTPCCCIVDDFGFDDFENLKDTIIPLPNSIFWEVGIR